MNMNFNFYPPFIPIILRKHANRLQKLIKIQIRVCLLSCSPLHTIEKPIPEFRIIQAYQAEIIK